VSLDWATRYPDIWSNIILGMTMSIFLDGINICIGRFSKTVRVGLTQSAEGLSRIKGWVEKSFLSVLQCARTLVFSYLWTQAQNGAIPLALLGVVFLAS
jgi:hypothetical protein